MTPNTPALPSASTLKVVAWRVSSDRSDVSHVTDNSARVSSLRKYPHTVVEPLCLLSNAQAEIQALRADARRYRLVRRGQHWSVIDGIGDTLRAEALDAAIDAAISATGEGG